MPVTNDDLFDAASRMNSSVSAADVERHEVRAAAARGAPADLPTSPAAREPRAPRVVSPPRAGVAAGVRLHLRTDDDGGEHQHRHARSMYQVCI